MHVVSSHAGKNFGAADLSAEVRGENIKCNEWGAVYCKLQFFETPFWIWYVPLIL